MSSNEFAESGERTDMADSAEKMDKRAMCDAPEDVIVQLDDTTDEVMTETDESFELSPDTEEMPLEEEINIDSEMRSLLDQSVQTMSLPRSHGEWSGDPGNSEFIMDDDYVPGDINTNPEGLTMREIKDRYGFEGVAYRGKEPDFSSFAEYSVEVDEFSDYRDGAGGTYEKAAEALADQTGMSREEINQLIGDNNLTWHESVDRRTMHLVPSEINIAYKHTGGISAEKGFNAFGEYLDDRFDGAGFSLQRESQADGGEVDVGEIRDGQKAIKGNIRKYRE